MNNIAVLASGSGSNAENLFRYFQYKNTARISLLLSNRPDAYVLERAKKWNVPAVVFNWNDFYNTSTIIDLLKEHHIDFIVLAGFLWLIPQNIIEAYPGRIVNIHPALLPSYGGKGMYGMNVHRAVVANHEKQSGITIHYVNSRYDEGDIIFQASCSVLSTDTPEMLAEKVHQLEYEHFPRIVDQLTTSPLQ